MNILKNCGTDVPQRQFVIPAAIDSLDKAVAAIAELSDKLNARLEAVMRHQKPQACPSDKVAKDPCSDVLFAQRIDAMCYALDATSRQLRDILDRLEL